MPSLTSNYFQPWVPPNTTHSFEDSLRLHKEGLISTKDHLGNAVLAGETKVVAYFTDKDKGEERAREFLEETLRAVPGGVVIVWVYKGLEWLWEKAKEHWPALERCYQSMADFLIEGVVGTIWEEIRLTVEGLFVTLAGWFETIVDWVEGWFEGAKEAAGQALDAAGQALEDVAADGYGAYTGASAWWSQREYDAQAEDRARQKAAAEEAGRNDPNKNTAYDDESAGADAYEFDGWMDQEGYWHAGMWGDEGYDGFDEPFHGYDNEDRLDPEPEPEIDII